MTRETFQISPIVPKLFEAFKVRIELPETTNAILKIKITPKKNHPNRQGIKSHKPRFSSVPNYRFSIFSLEICSFVPNDYLYDLTLYTVVLLGILNTLFYNKKVNDSYAMGRIFLNLNFCIRRTKFSDKKLKLCAVDFWFLLTVGFFVFARIGVTVDMYV
jgi:hypothetical protein